MSIGGALRESGQVAVGGGVAPLADVRLRSDAEVSGERTERLGELLDRLGEFTLLGSDLAEFFP